MLAAALGVPLGIRGEHGHDIIDSLQPLPGEIVIDKASYGAFCFAGRARR